MSVIGPRPLLVEYLPYYTMGVTMWLNYIIQDFYIKVCKRSCRWQVLCI